MLNLGLKSLFFTKKLTLIERIEFFKIYFSKYVTTYRRTTFTDDWSAKFGVVLEIYYHLFISNPLRQPLNLNFKKKSSIPCKIKFYTFIFAPLPKAYARGGTGRHATLRG